MSKSYSKYGDETTDAIPPETTEEAPPEKKLTPIGLKFRFLGKALSDPESRNKRRPRITAFDGAVLTVLVDHFNKERGFSFIGCRKIAEILDATPSGIARSIRKLKDLEIILEASGGYRNRAQRLAPNFADYVHGYTVDSAVNGHSVDGGVNGHSVVVPSTAMPSTNPVGSRPKGKGPFTGAAGATRSERAGARRSATSSPSASKIMELVKGGRHG